MLGVHATDLAHLRSVTQPVHAGQSDFFVLNGINAKTNRYYAQIVSHDSAGHCRKWTNNGINVNPVIYAHKLYYVHQGPHGGQLICRSLTDRNRRLVKTGTGSVSQLHLSGHWLYFKVTVNHEIPKYHTSQFPRTRKVIKLVNKQDGYGWLPNHATNLVKLYDLKRNLVTTVMKSHHDFNLQSFVPRRHQILYLQTTRHLKNDINRAQGAFCYDLKNDRTTLINQQVPSGVFHTARFSPDGKLIALVGNDNRYPSVTVNDFWLYNVANHRLVNLTKRLDDVDVGYAGGLSTDFAQQRSNVEMRWLNSRDYLFHAYHHGRSQLYLGRAHRIKLVSDRKREIYDFNVIDSTEVVLSSSKQTQPCELRHLSLNNGQEISVFNPNRQFEQTHRYAKVSAFKYRSKDQKVMLSGWVMHSLKPQTQSPVILYVHGGPHDAYGESFFHEFQVLATHGYSIVYVNPRGSTTYGQQFETDVIGHYGEHDYADVMSGLSAALRRFKDLDPHRVFIIGGSYGGFMVLWTIGHSNRFTAAIAQRPLADWRMQYGTSDIGIRFCRDELGCDLYRDHADALYRKESPITYAMNVKTPLLLQHGEYDMRCPACLSEAYFTAVKQTGTEVRYVRYPQGYHGVSRHGLPSLRIQRIKDILTWLDAH